MITVSELIVWRVECERCGRPDHVIGEPGEVPEDTHAALEFDGWEVDPLRCPSCVAECGIPVSVLAADQQDERSGQ